MTETNLYIEEIKQEEAFIKDAEKDIQFFTPLYKKYFTGYEARINIKTILEEAHTQVLQSLKNIKMYREKVEILKRINQ